MQTSQELYGSRDLSGNYADMGTAMGGYAERIEDPSEIGPAFQRARQMNQDCKSVLLEFITTQETDTSHKRAF